VYHLQGDPVLPVHAVLVFVLQVLVEHVVKGGRVDRVEELLKAKLLLERH
jgi:hypothetical protein